MKLEQRYTVLKQADLTDPELRAAIGLAANMEHTRGTKNKPPLTCLVIEKDWPEYEPALAMLSERVDREAGVTKGVKPKLMAFGVELVAHDRTPPFGSIENLLTYFRKPGIHEIEAVRLQANDIELLRLHGHVKEYNSIVTPQRVIDCVEVCHGVQEGTYLKIDGKKVVPSKHAARWANKKKLMSLIAKCSDISYIVMQPEDIKLILRGTGFENMYSEEVLNGKPAPVQEVKLKHSHYHKNVANLEMIDIYRIIDLYGITDPCIQHAIKKLLVAGGRGGGKDIQKDIQESIDTLVRWQDMRLEDLRVGSTLEATVWGGDNE